MAKSKLYVVGVDGSDCSRRAVEFATGLAGDTGAQLLLVHVINWSGYTPMNVMEVVERPLEKSEEDRIARDDILGPAADTVAAAGIGVRTWYSWGHAATMIVQQAFDEGADLIVMGRRGHGPIAELIMGSVSNAVSHHSAIPVILVP